jgi:hypothetical protein
MPRHHFALLDLAIAEGQDLQQGERLLGLLVRRQILHDRRCLAVLGDDERLPLLGKFTNELRGVRFDVADGFDPRGVFHADVI